MGKTITYAVGIDEPLHPDPEIAWRIGQHEVAMSDCGYGCKIYADTQSAVTVLAHNRTYGCTITRSTI